MGQSGKRFRTNAMRAQKVHISLLPPTATATLPTGTRTDQPQQMLTRSSSWVATHLPWPATRPWTEASWALVLVHWEPLFSVPPSKVPSTGPNRARASTPVEGGRGKPTLEEAPPLVELELEDKILTERSGSSCPPARAAPATVAGGGGKHLERMSLEQGSLAVSLVAPLTVAAAVTTASLSTTTMVSTATSRTREVSTTRTLTRTETLTARASAETTRGGPGATPLVGATTVETCRAQRGIPTTPGPTRPAATKDDEECELCNYLILKTCEIHNICGK